MGRAPCCFKVGLRRGPWSPTEDTLLKICIDAHGEGKWRSLPKKAGLLRCGKSCRLRWVNYLRPGIKRGDFGPDEDDLIIRLHSLLGNRWSLIAGRLPGRTDNEIKNYWNIHLSRRLGNAGNIPTYTHKEFSKHAPKPRERTSRSTNNTSRKDHSNITTVKAIADGPRTMDHPNMTNVKVIADGPPPTETKIYIPKPIRLSSFSFTANKFLNNPVSQSSTEEEVVDKGIDNAELSNPPSSCFELLKDASATDGGVQLRDYEDDVHDLFNGFDLSRQLQCLGGDNFLNNLYDEYLQLV